MHSSGAISACTAVFTTITAATFFSHFAMFLVSSGTALFAFLTRTARTTSSDFTLRSHYIIN